jgi:hypothetical protein
MSFLSSSWPGVVFLLLLFFFSLSGRGSTDLASAVSLVILDPSLFLLPTAVSFIVICNS